MRVQSQASIRSHVLQLPAASLAARFRPFAAKVLAWAGVDPTAPARARARAVVGWFAANAVHPQAFLHPAGTTKNLGVLPDGETWASFNAAFYTDAAQARDQAYWYSLFPNGVSMLQKLIGTTAADGTVADDGMLTEYAPGQWRIRNFANFRAPQCTLQCKMAQVVLAAMGIPSVDISTVGHDPMCFYDIEAGRWSYIDPTFGEMLTVVGRDQSPLDLLQASLSGYSSAVVSDKLPGADYIPVGYFTSPNLAPGGMSFMTVHTAPQWAGGLSARAPYRFGDLPSQSAANDRAGTMAQIMPELGVGISGLVQTAQTTQVRLRSIWPGHVRFHRRKADAVDWSVCSDTDFVARESGDYLYRSVDVDGLAGTIAAISS